MTSIGSRPEAPADAGHLVRERDVDGAEDVLVELGQLGCLRRATRCARARRSARRRPPPRARTPVSRRPRRAARPPGAQRRLPGVDALRRERDEHVASRRAGRARRAARRAARASCRRSWCWSARSAGPRRACSTTVCAGGAQQPQVRLRVARRPASARRSATASAPASASASSVSRSRSAVERRLPGAPGRPASRSTVPSRMSCSRRSLTSIPITFETGVRERDARRKADVPEAHDRDGPDRRRSAVVGVCRRRDRAGRDALQDVVQRTGQRGPQRGLRRTAQRVGLRVDCQGRVNHPSYLG